MNRGSDSVLIPSFLSSLYTAPCLRNRTEARKEKELHFSCLCSHQPVLEVESHYFKPLTCACNAGCILRQNKGSQNSKKLNSVALVCERNVSTERPQRVGEVSASF
jgi:hypothetical protein